MTTAGPFGTPEPTTAQTLGQYRRDLETEGFDPAQVRDLVRSMAMHFNAEELRVSPLDPDSSLVAAMKAHRAAMELLVAINPPERTGKCGCCKCAGEES